MMALKKHIPSYIVIAGYRALISYDGQPQTCYGCSDTEHMYNVCRNAGERRPRYLPQLTTHGPT
jgi:hypothetical protein